jgi:hypothetical protein
MSLSNLILQVENVLQRAIVSVSPRMRHGFGLKQLCRDAHSVGLGLPPATSALPGSAKSR